MIDDFKESTGTALRLTSLAAAAALALLIATSFLCAAAFVFVFQKYGLIEACLSGAGIFFVVTLIAAASYMVRNRRAKVRAEETAKSAARSALSDPMLMAAGIQIVRAIGTKKLIPVLVLGGWHWDFWQAAATTTNRRKNDFEFNCSSYTNPGLKLAFGYNVPASFLSIRPS